MLNRGSQEQDVLKWKEKYLDSLDEQEAIERSFTEQLNYISSGLLQLCRIARGHDKQLDKELDTLKNLLQKDSLNDKIRPSIQKLNDLVSTAKQNQFKNNDKIAHYLHISINQLQELDLPYRIKRNLRVFNKTIYNKVEEFNRYPELISELVQCQLQAINHINNQELNKTKSFLSRLFGKTKNNKIRKTNNLTSSTQSSDVTFEQLDLETNENKLKDPGKGKLPKFSEFVAILITLLHKINISNDILEKAKQLEEEIKHHANHDNIVDYLNKLSDLISEGIDQEQKAFEQYLNNINDRLAEIQSYLNKVSHHEKDKQDSTENLNKNVSARIHKIKDNIKNSQDLNQLKKSINHSLDEIAYTLNEFHEKEKSKGDSLTNQLQGLIERVQQMESESEKVWKKLEQQKQRALEDPLTKLPNRAGYSEKLQLEFLKWKEFNTPLSVALGDIDHFKKINDSFGHLAGDKVLQVIAKLAMKTLRQSDFIARFGGEEFIILMPNTSANEAIQAVEKMRMIIEKCAFHYQKKPVKITISFGIDEFRTNDIPEYVIKRADQALYTAKRNGRNQSCLASANTQSKAI